MSTYRLTKARGIAVVSTWRLTKARGSATGPLPPPPTYRLVRARGTAIPNDTTIVTAPPTVEPGEAFTISATSTAPSPTWGVSQIAGTTLTPTGVATAGSWMFIASTPAETSQVTFRVTATTDYGSVSSDVTITIWAVSEYRSDGTVWRPRVLMRF